jgi:hypothetical protein
MLYYVSNMSAVNCEDVIEGINELFWAVNIAIHTELPNHCTQTLKTKLVTSDVRLFRFRYSYRTSGSIFVKSIVKNGISFSFI